MKIDARMVGVLPISMGVCTVLLVSACSISPPRGTPPQQVRGVPSQTDVDNDLRKRGYKPAIYGGERVYCRNEALTGSNLESKVCLTAQQIEDQERSGKDVLKNRGSQNGCLPSKNLCN